jgi:hypothetical protein
LPPKNPKKKAFQTVTVFALHATVEVPSRSFSIFVLFFYLRSNPKNYTSLACYSSPQLSFVVLAAAALAALSASLVSATVDVKFIVAEDNTIPFFIGSEKLAGASTAMSTAVTGNAAVSSLLDAALSKKYDNATVAAWRRLMTGNATLVASSGPALSGDIKCFVGDDGEVVGLQYGTALVCKKSSRVVNVKIGTNYVSNIKVSSFFACFFWYESGVSRTLFPVVVPPQRRRVEAKTPSLSLNLDCIPLSFSSLF